MSAILAMLAPLVRFSHISKTVVVVFASCCCSVSTYTHAHTRTLCKYTQCELEYTTSHVSTLAIPIQIIRLDVWWIFVSISVICDCFLLWSHFDHMNNNKKADKTRERKVNKTKIEAKQLLLFSDWMIFQPIIKCSSFESCGMDQFFVLSYSVFWSI